MQASGGLEDGSEAAGERVVHHHITVEGIVQGVGFRPFVHRLVSASGLSGQVHNFTGGVEIDIEGPEHFCRAFSHDLVKNAPPIAVIEKVRIVELPLQGYEGFTITPSAPDESGPIFVSPEVATCADCRRELGDPADRHYLHPFVNCTNCGPRYTIIRSMPYDRPSTSMAPFEMCKDCAREYADIDDRRYHAQPVACNNCGASLWLEVKRQRIHGHEAIVEARRLLREGKIVAVKGLGGFHLACDATNEKAVARLRERKHREEKPLACMVPDIEMATRLADFSDRAKELLCGPQTPIVLGRKRQPGELAASVAPDSTDYGLMLPYTPIHHLLLREGERLEANAFTAIVMTSGNVSDEPLAVSNAEARRRLSHIADAFLLHDREILIGCDDSVVRDSSEGPIFLRRARGYVPFPVRLGEDLRPILALGGNMKNCLCLTSGQNAFLSQHLGDLEDAKALEYFKHAAKHMVELFQTRPEALACDLHPDYLSTRHGRKWAGELGIPLFQSQHHHSHIVACMAEHHAEGPVIGIACDGAGLGDDGTIWGCEILRCTHTGYERLGHLKYVPLPGGDMAVKQPYRTAMAWLYELYGADAVGIIERLYASEIAGLWPIFKQMIDKDINCPQASSSGRLFDAVSALLGVCMEATYEGQPAVMLESAAEAELAGASPDVKYDFGLSEERLLMDPAPLLRRVVKDRLAGVDVGQISALFHAGFAAMLHEATLAACNRERIETVALSGGTFANRILVETLASRLRRSGLEVLLHKNVPPGDGCLSLGQAIIADHWFSGRP